MDRHQNSRFANAYRAANALQCLKSCTTEFFLRGCAPQNLIAARVFQRDFGDLDHSRTGHGSIRNGQCDFSLPAGKSKVRRSQEPLLKYRS